MVKVRVKRNHSMVEEIQISGHAGYANAGEDLVCAGVSSIAVGMMNALDKLVNNTCLFEMESAYIKVFVVKQESEETQLLLEAFLIQLQTLQESYKEYINIFDQEV